MASIRQDPDSKIYRIRFRFCGKSYNRSIKTKDFKTAKSILGRVEETIRLIEQGRLEIPQKIDPGVFILSDGKITSIHSKTKHVSLKQLFKEYLSRLPAAAKEANTVKLETSHIKHFNRLLKTSQSASATTPADLQRYVEKRLKEKRYGRLISPETVKREMDTFRSVWNWAKKEYVEGDSPTLGLIIGKADAKPPFMTMDEIETRIARGGLTDLQQKELWECLYLTSAQTNELLAYAEEKNRYPFVYPMLVFVAYTGVRRSEMMRSLIDDFDFDSKSVLIREKKHSRSKATTFRRVDMNSNLIQVMKNWFSNHPGGQFSFCMPPQTNQAPKQLTRDQARDQFDRTFQKSKWENVRGYHVLRHSFASNLASKGVDQRVIDLWMGHQTEAMRLRYRHLLPSTRRNAIELLTK